MATYAEYLDFDTEEDKLKQQQLYQATELSAQTVAAVKKISRPQNWLLAAAPYCPDCRVFVPFIQKMAELNPNI
ncbi:thioredoxin family protein, partial [Neisseria sp. P0015.S004]